MIIYNLAKKFISALTGDNKKGTKQLVYLLMLLQLENTNQDEINKLLKFAQQNHLKLSLIDDTDNNYLLPGKPLTPEQLKQLIENSRNSGIISMENAHRLIRNA